MNHLQTKINQRFDVAKARLDNVHSLVTADDRRDAQLEWEATHPERSRRRHNRSAGVGNFLKKSLAAGAALLAVTATVELVGRAIDQNDNQYDQGAKVGHIHPNNSYVNSGIGKDGKLHVVETP